MALKLKIVKMKADLLFFSILWLSSLCFITYIVLVAYKISFL